MAEGGGLLNRYFPLADHPARRGHLSGNSVNKGDSDGPASGKRPESRVPIGVQQARFSPSGVQQRVNELWRFGVERVRQEWTVLRVDGTREVERAKPPAERALRHIEEGFARAAARH